MNSVGRTHVGMRREQNQDSILLLPDRGVYAVADGMGGHRGGQVASRLVTDGISRAALHEEDPLDSQSLAEILEDVNTAVHEAGLANEGLRAMGSTCVLVHVDSTSVHVAHVGDSRAYLLTPEGPLLLTHDHRAIQPMIDDGLLSIEESRNHPLRCVLTRSIGVDATVSAEASTRDWHAGDRLLLCSDGLSDYVGEGSFLELAREATDLELAGDQLIQMANDAGGDDNISLILIENV
jgi:PPM family protein phosphatase